MSPVSAPHPEKAAAACDQRSAAGSSAPWPTPQTQRRSWSSQSEWPAREPCLQEPGIRRDQGAPGPCSIARSPDPVSTDKRTCFSKTWRNSDCQSVGTLQSSSRRSCASRSRLEADGNNSAANTLMSTTTVNGCRVPWPPPTHQSGSARL